MRLLNSKIYLGLLISTVAFIAVLLSYFFNQYAVLILTIQAICLTTIYSIGTMIIEHKVKEEYGEIINEVSESASKLDDHYSKAREELVKLKQKFKNGSGKNG